MILQRFANDPYDGGAYCDFDATAASAMAGKDILLCIWDADGSNLLAIAGQQGLSINRSTDAIEVTSKDTEGGWRSKIAGMKEWSIDSDGVYVADDESHAALSSYFENGDLVCVKVVKNDTNKTGLFGGLAVISDYSIDAPYDDSVSYSITLEGNGALTDLSA